MDLPDSWIPLGGVGPRRRSLRRAAGMTLVEVVIALVIVAIVFGSIIMGYTTSGKVTEWSGYSLAAQSQAAQVLEQVRSATWDPTANKCEMTNVPLQNPVISYTSGTTIWTNYSGYLTAILDVPWKSTNYITVTNYVNMKYVPLAVNTNIQFIMVRVDSVWPFGDWSGPLRFYTNTICAYLAPDNSTTVKN